jgi:hypothetical protein
MEAAESWRGMAHPPAPQGRRAEARCPTRSGPGAQRIITCYSRPAA